MAKATLSELFNLLAPARQMVTMTYDSLVDMRASMPEAEFHEKDSFKTTIQFTVHRFKNGKMKAVNPLKDKVRIRRVIQVNPLLHYREQKAKKEGISPSKVEVKPLPKGWSHVEGSPQMVVKDGYPETTAMRGAPIRTLEVVGYYVDGKPATELEQNTIRFFAKPPRPPKPEDKVNIKNYTLAHIRQVKVGGMDLDVE
jgi:hypothetical protein